MAKKRTSSKKRPSKSTRGKRLKFPGGKIFGGLALLILLVLAGAVVAYHLIPRPLPRTAKVGSLPSAGHKQDPTQYRKPPKPTKPEPMPAKSMPTERPTPSVVSEPGPVSPEREVKKPTYEIFPEKSDPPPKQLKDTLPQPKDHLPMVAIVVDDIGYDRQMAQQLLAIDAPLTFSMLPFSPFSRDIMAQALAEGREIMLHLPMEPNEYPTVQPGPGAILSSMNADDVIAQLMENIQAVPGLRGVNNHMGSRISTSPEQMRQIFSILKKQGLFYIDSRTTAATVAEPSARLLELPFAERDIFIDHFDDPVFIQSQLDKLVQQARRQGYAIGIAHPHANTVRALSRFIPKLGDKVRIVSASTVIQTVMLAESQKKTAAKRPPP